MSIDFGTDIYEEPLVAKRCCRRHNAEVSLRSPTLAEYIGPHQAIAENLPSLSRPPGGADGAAGPCAAPRPSGPGKTTLAGIIAAEMGVNIHASPRPGH